MKSVLMLFLALTRARALGLSTRRCLSRRPNDSFLARLGGVKRAPRGLAPRPATVEGAAPDRPPTLPSGTFRPKQSLGQNYLSDQNYATKIVDSLEDGSDRGALVVELGPGLGALTRLLLRSYPEMVAVEIDGRAVELLEERYPKPFTVLHSDVLAVDYSALAALRGGRLSVIGNLPYYITSQILFCLCDHHAAVRRAVVTMQLEVAQRLVAKPRSKDYGILSVVFQLYASPKIAFKIPHTAFYPQPKVTSALVTIDFPEDRDKFPVDPRKLRAVVTTAFRQRRKMLRQSLKSILNGVVLPDKYATKRPEELAPQDFLDLTGVIFGFEPETADDAGAPIWRSSKLRKGDF